MTKEEAKAYAQKLLTESGVSETEATQYLKLFENDKFVNGFIPRPEVDRALDSERNKYSQYKQRNEYLEGEWLPQARSAHEKNMQGIEMLQKYITKFGPIESAQDARDAAQATGLTVDKVDEIVTKRLEDAIRYQSQNVLDLQEIREDHIEKFKTRLPLKKFEQFVEDQRKSGSYQGLRSAYRDFIEEDMEKLRTASQTEREKQLRAEIERDVLTRHKIPTDARPKEAHLLFDRLKTTGKDGDGSGAGNNGKSAREEFLEVLNDPNPETVRQRYPV